MEVTLGMEVPVMQELQAVSTTATKREQELCDAIFRIYHAQCFVEAGNPGSGLNPEFTEAIGDAAVLAAKRGT